MSLKVCTGDCPNFKDLGSDFEAMQKYFWECEIGSKPLQTVRCFSNSVQVVWLKPKELK